VAVRKGLGDNPVRMGRIEEEVSVKRREHHTSLPAERGGGEHRRKVFDGLGKRKNPNSAYQILRGELLGKKRKVKCRPQKGTCEKELYL